MAILTLPSTTIRHTTVQVQTTALMFLLHCVTITTLHCLQFHSTCNHAQWRRYPYIIVVHAPNFASILTKVKFQGCCVMKIKVNARFLGESTFEFITVILNFFSICTLFKEHKKHMLCKIRNTIFPILPIQPLPQKKKKPKMCLT